MNSAAKSSPTERYRRYGDNIPEKETLSSLYHDLSSDRYLSTLTRAHVGIDMAVRVGMDNGKHQKWLSKAKSHLESILSLDVQLDRIPTSEAQVEAAIGIAQIPLWDAIITNDASKTPSYETMLTWAPTLMQNALQSGKALSKTMEFMPLLLGQRAFERTGIGWIGRTALRREDCRKPSRTLEEIDPSGFNWDIGYTFDCHFPGALLDPPHKRNNKISHEPGEDDYKNGILALISRQVGTNNIRDILSGCLQEFGEAKSPIGSLELDDITGELYENLKLNKISESS